MAAGEAIAASGLITRGIDPAKVNVDPTRMAINVGAGIICCELPELAPATALSTTEGRFDLRKWGKEGLDCVTPLWLLKYLPNMLACHIGIIHDIQGPSNTITCGEASAQLAIGEAAQVIARGDADVAVAGAAEAKVNQLVMVRQHLLAACRRHAATATRTPSAGRSTPAPAARSSARGPAWSCSRTSTTPAHETRGFWRRLPALATVTACAPAMRGWNRTGRSVQIAVEKALGDAEIGPEDLDLVIPHGTAVPAGRSGGSAGPGGRPRPAPPDECRYGRPRACSARPAPPAGRWTLWRPCGRMVDGVIPPAEEFRQAGRRAAA